MSASDVITYIGVPLAVLGVLPILYNTAITLAARSRILRMLRHGRLTALTRSDVVNRVIEVELPRYAITPWDRHADAGVYWGLSDHPSPIPGGSWTTFNWRSNAIGLRTQRVEYADQLRQPQSDVAFDELICYLLDLGAVPDPHGWRLLRTSGMWTPVGCALMSSPDRLHYALTIATADDSDGLLSLAVAWKSDWTQRDPSCLPPYWLKLSPYPSTGAEAATTEATGPPEPPEPPEPPAYTIAEKEPNGSLTRDVERDAGLDLDVLPGRPTSAKAKKAASLASVDSIQREAESNAQNAISCHITAVGLTEARPEHVYCTPSSSSSPASDPDALYIDHLSIRPGRSDGVWFASATTALGASTGETVLWSYAIPNEVLLFSRAESVPCGVLVELGFVDESATPEWATQYDKHAELEQQMRRHRVLHAAMRAEAAMSPADRSKAIHDRTSNPSIFDDMRDRRHAEMERAEKRITEALHSPKWGARTTAELGLRWLRAHGHEAAAPASATPAASPAAAAASSTADFQSSPTPDDQRAVAGDLLRRMLLDGELTGHLCRMLDLWRAWADNAGMRRSDLDALRADPVAFARASLLLAAIADSGGALDAGSLSSDMHYCLKTWSKVRLG